MPTIASALLLLALATGAQAHALRAPARVRARAAFPLRRARPLQMSEAGDDVVTDKAKQAAAKRLEAERLALEAERAALEAERLALRAQEKRLAKRAEEAGSETSAPAPAPPPPPVSLLKETEAGSPGTLPSTDGKFDFEDALNKLEAQANATDLQRSMAGGLGNVLQRSGLSASEIQLSEAQIEAAQEKVFSLDSFFVKKVEQSPVGTIFTGNLRSTPDKVAARVSEQSAAAGGVLSGVQFLLLEDPRPLSVEQIQSGEEKQPVYLALSPQAAALSQPWQEKVAALVAVFLSIISTLGYALSAFILADDGKILQQLQDGDSAALDIALPIALGLGAIQVVHELAHLVVAGRYGLKTGVPLLLPSLQLGTFGCITPLLSFPKTRQQLLDFALAGPVVASGVSLVLFIVGLALSTGDYASSVDAASIPVLPTGLLKSSLLLGSLAQAFLPSIATQVTVQIHPLAVVGFTGALLNALQLLPIGRLDGGRAALAALGQSGGGLLSGLFLLGLGISSIFIGDNPILLFFGLFIIFLQRAPEIPAEDDLTEVDSSRQVAALTALAFCLLTLVPLSGAGPPSDGFM